MITQLPAYTGSTKVIFPPRSKKARLIPDGEHLAATESVEWRWGDILTPRTVLTIVHTPTLNVVALGGRELRALQVDFVRGRTGDPVFVAGVLLIAAITLTIWLSRRTPKVRPAILADRLIGEVQRSLLEAVKGPQDQQSPLSALVDRINDAHRLFDTAWRTRETLPPRIADAVDDYVKQAQTFLEKCTDGSVPSVEAVTKAEESVAQLISQF